MNLNFNRVKVLQKGGRRAPLLLFFLFISLFVSFSKLSLASVAPPQDERKVFGSVGISSEWKRILFYQKSIFGIESGMVDSQGFYLSPNGQRDPVAELIATHEAFIRHGYRVPKLNIPAACAYPARLDFMLRNGLITLKQIPEHQCPEVEKWLSERKYESMWLVFSSWYPANPASMYGHTFLRFRRSDRDSDLLDDAINFAAQVDNVNDFSFAFNGLLGGFAGRFSMMPYHLKINEYNNVESRDLWEYRISADREQIRRVVLSILEVGPHFFNYFYLDENCSWVILKIMETGDPSWNFMPDFKFWVVPVDTVKWAVHDRGPEVVQKNRISMQQKFKQRYEFLDESSRRQFLKVIALVGDGKKSGELEKSDFSVLGNAQNAVQQRRLLDALLDWVDFQDAAGTDKREGISDLRKKLFKLRAANPGEPDVLVGLPESSNPLRGHGSTHVRLGVVRQPDERTSAAFSWTPALHELLGPTTGYARGLEIAMFRMGAWWDDRKHSLVVNDLGLFRIRGLTPKTEAEKPASWFIDIGYTTDNVCPEIPRGCQSSSLALGRGATVAIPLGGDFADIYAGAFVAGETGILRRRDDKDRFFLGAGPRFDLWYGDDSVRLTYSAFAHRMIDGQRAFTGKWQQQAGLGASLTPSADVRISWSSNGLRIGDLTQLGQSFSIMAGMYF